jgi:hypothetical protein
MHNWIVRVVYDLGAIRQRKSSEYITTIYCFLIGLQV